MRSDASPVRMITAPFSVPMTSSASQPCLASMSRTAIPDGPHAIPTFASGDRSHQCRIFRSSRVASFQPFVVSGVFPRGLSGNTW